MPDLVLPSPVAQRLTRLARRRGEPRTDPRGIRRRRANDLGACARLAVLSTACARRPSSWRGWLDADEVVEAWVAERQGELLGHVALCEVNRDARSGMRWREVTGHPASDLLAVSRLFVRPRVRSQGLGTALLDMAVAGARARGRIPVLEAVGAGREELRLYEDQGWRPVALCPARHRSDGLDSHFYLAPRASA